MQESAVCTRSDFKLRGAGKGTPAIFVAFNILLTLVYLSPLTCTAAPIDPSHSESPSLQTGDLYALVVGVSKYRDPKIPKLDLSDNDAKDFGEFLEAQKKVFRETRVTLLTNEKATKSEIEKYLYYTLPKAGKNDTIVLFFSGHGAYDPMRPTEFLFLPYDTEPVYLGTSCVKMSGLEFLKGVEAERVLIIADACHSGKLDRLSDIPPLSYMKPKALASPVELFMQEFRSSTGRAIITSTSKDQLSWEIPSLRNSVFTHNLLEGLKGKADRDHDGVVTLSEAYEYAYARTKEETQGRQHPQLENKVVGAFPLSFVGPPVPAAELKKRILLAAASGQLAKVEESIGDRIGIESRDDNNNTPLILAARSGHTDVVKLLLAKGADVEARNNTQGTALMAASETGRTEVVKLLLASHANVNAKNGEGFTALAFAARAGRVDVARLLLSQAADVRARTDAGKTTLNLAASFGHTDMVKLLLESGADISAKGLDCGTALSEAARRGHSDIVKLLLEKGASISTRGGIQKEGELILATLRDDEAGVKVALAANINVNAQTDAGDTALGLAAALDHVKAVNMLLDKGANTNSRANDGLTPLILASRSGRVAVSRLLLSHRADPAIVDNEGNTALMWAAHYGCTDALKLLSGSKTGFETKNREGSTALILAAINGHTDAVRLLLDAGANLNAADKSGNTALMLSSQKNHTEIVKLLCTRQAQVNLKNNRGNTALTLAAKNGHKEVVKILLARGVDLASQDWEGKSALTLAQERGWTDVAELLKVRR